MTLEDQIRAALIAGSQVHVYPSTVHNSGFDATVRSRGGVHHAAMSGADPIVALKGALTEDDRWRRERQRLQHTENGQMEMLDALADVDPFADMLG